jgi:hypothetical protein
MRALDHVYHIACFLCVGCGRQLQKGDQFVIRAGRLFCRPDFEKEMALLQLSNNRSENSANNANNGQSVPSINGNPQRQDGRRGPKRPRTILTTAQRRAFKASFEVSQKPCRKVFKIKVQRTDLLFDKLLTIMSCNIELESFEFCFTEINFDKSNKYILMTKMMNFVSYFNLRSEKLSQKKQDSVFV